MKFRWLLFDADNTLLDFTNASKQAFWQTMQDFHKPCTEADYKCYKTINHAVWTAFEQEKITAERLRIQRMELFLEAINDATTSPEKFSKQYLNNLILKSEMYEGVPAILERLQKKYLLSIVTNGLKEVQRPRLKKLNLLPYFKSIIVSDEIGVAKPSIAYFEQVYASIPNPPPKKEILVIGDNLHSDILGGINFGVPTCWLHHGKTNETTITPTFEIEHIYDLEALLEGYNG